MKIAEITKYGEVKISFSQKMLIPDISEVMLEGISVEITSNLELYDPKEMLTSWNITTFREKYMWIKLNL